MDILAKSSPPSKVSCPLAIPTTCLSELFFQISGNGQPKFYSDICFQTFTVFTFRILIQSSFLQPLTFCPVAWHRIEVQTMCLSKLTSYL